MTQKRRQHMNAAAAAKALDESFTAYVSKLETVKSFEYLGRMLRYDGNDALAICTDLGRARLTRGLISRVLRAENASPRVCSLLYKTTIQADLLLGGEVGNIAPYSMRSYEGFHLRTARHMAGMMPWRSPNLKNWTWTYNRRRRRCWRRQACRCNTILKFVAQRPFMEICLEA